MEGGGENGGEDMTGGCVVVLGPTGKNFAAGMSGGVVYVLDEGNALYRNLNKGQVLMEKVESKFDREELWQMPQDHVAATGSETARQVLDDSDAYLSRFKTIIPGEYKKPMTRSAKLEQQGMSREEPQTDACSASVAGKEG